MIIVASFEGLTRDFENSTYYVRNGGGIFRSACFFNDSCWVLAS